MQHTKNQHYVPRFLLRGFINEQENETINIYDMIQQKYRQANIKNVFSENYTYGKDSIIDNNVNNPIEINIAPVINLIRSHNFDDINKEKNNIIQFLCHQLSRTRKSGSEIEEFVQKNLQKLLRKVLKNKFPDEETEDYGCNLTKEYKQELLSSRTADGVLHSMLMNDLNIHVLVNKTDIEFIISDQPSVHYNWFYKDLNDPLATCLFTKGTQIFCPISKAIYLCAYDPKIYKYGTKSSNISYIDLKCEQDIIWLNDLQVRSSLRFIGFSSQNMRNHINKLVLSTPKNILSQVVINSNDLIRTLSTCIKNNIIQITNEEIASLKIILQNDKNLLNYSILLTNLQLSNFKDHKKILTELLQDKYFIKYDNEQIQVNARVFTIIKNKPSFFKILDKAKQFLNSTEFRNIDSVSNYMYWLDQNKIESGVNKKSGIIK